MYNINWRLLIYRVLPTFLRNATNFWIEWIYTLAFPVVQLHSEFLVFRTESILELHYNSQTLLFEKLLNDTFLVSTIKIINHISSVELVTIFPHNFGIITPIIYPKNHNILSPIVLPFALQPSLADFDFTVEVPVSITAQETVLKALVNKYKHSSTTYNIVYI